MARDADRSRRVIGGILSLGFPMPGPQVDNYDFVSAPSFFDYDALVVDPSALSELIEGVIAGPREDETFGGRPVRNQPRAPDDVSLADALLRRRDETAMALRNGAVIVCFARPAIIHRDVTGIDEIDDYYWLPRSEGVTYSPPQLITAEGSRIHVVDYEHPLAAFVSGQLANIGYRAYFDISKIPSMDARRVFARSEGGAAVGVEFLCTPGRIIFLPSLARAPAGEDRYAMSDALQAGIRRALGVVAEGRPPPWVSAHPLPGLDERAAARQDARRSLDGAQSALDDAERSHDELARYQRLLWQEGALGLDDVVIDALRMIGFEVYAQDRLALELRASETRVFVEIEASDATVDIAVHHRLRQRIERAIERTGSAPRGLLLVNGLRLQPPRERAQQVSDPLRVAAETMRYCIATTTSLFEAVRAKLEGDDATAAEYARRITVQDGYIG